MSNSKQQQQQQKKEKEHKQKTIPRTQQQYTVKCWKLLKETFVFIYNIHSLKHTHTYAYIHTYKDSIYCFIHLLKQDKIKEKGKRILLRKKNQLSFIFGL